VAPYHVQYTPEVRNERKKVGIGKEKINGLRAGASNATAETQ